MAQRVDQSELPIDVLGAMTALSARSAVALASDEQIEYMHQKIQDLVASHDVPEKRQAAWMELGECFFATNQNLVLRLVAPDGKSTCDVNEPIDGPTRFLCEGRYFLIRIWP